MGTCVEIQNATGGSRVGSAVGLIAAIQLINVAARNGAKGIGKGNASARRTMARHASHIGSQVDEASERTPGDGNEFTLGIDGKHGKGGRTRLRGHVDRRVG